MTWLNDGRIEKHQFLVGNARNPGTLLAEGEGLTLQGRKGTVRMTRIFSVERPAVPQANKGPFLRSALDALADLKVKQMGQEA